MLAVLREEARSAEHTAGCVFSLLIGYFECIDSERGICWRCSDSLSLRVSLGMEERTPDHSSLSRIRNRLPLEVRICIWMGARSSSVERDDRWQDTGCGRDDAGSECGASVNRSSRHGGKLRIVFEGACAQEWYRRAEPSGHCKVGQEAAKERVEQGVGESERAGCGIGDGFSWNVRRRSSQRVVDPSRRVQNIHFGATRILSCFPTTTFLRTRRS